MKRMSLQWRLTCITTLCIAIICGCLTMFVYKNGVHYIDSLQDAVESQGDEKGNKSDEIYISIPDDKWDEFADEFSVQVYNNKADYKRNSLIITVLLALLGGVVTYFISGHALRPIREFSDKIEEVQAQNLSDSRIEENNVKELNQLGISYNKMLERLSEAFEIQRQFTANAAHELRTPLALMQVQLDLYNSASHPGNDADTLQTIKMVTEQNEKLNRMVKTLLDMSELQTVGRDDKIILDAIVEEVLADLEPLAVEKNIKLIGKCEDATMIGSDILIYRLVYNLVENAIKYNHPLGQVTVTAYQRNKHVYLSVEDTGSGIPKELRERVFELVSDTYRYNLTLFKEIKRFWNMRYTYGWNVTLINLVGNVVCFLPFGFLLPTISRKPIFKNIITVTIWAMLLSFGIETAQLLTKVGAFDVDDIFLNTLGGCLGYIIFRLTKLHKHVM